MDLGRSNTERSTDFTCGQYGSGIDEPFTTHSAHVQPKHDFLQRLANVFGVHGLKQL